ncbi:MAG: TetR/AcrR family transcriptional regulator [Pararhodobacter sp.]
MEISNRAGTQGRARVKAQQARSRETRARLIEAAHEIAEAGGLGALRAETVVARAGVSKGTFFAHFPDKDHLLAELLRERLVYRPGAGDLAALLERLHPLLHATAAEPEALPVVVRFSGETCTGPGLGNAIVTMVAHISADIAVLQGQGHVRAGPEPAILGEATMALVFHAAGTTLCAVDAPGAREQNAIMLDAEQLLAAMVNALLAP